MLSILQVLATLKLCIYQIQLAHRSTNILLARNTTIWVMVLHQVDCFKINMRFWKYLAIWPGYDPTHYYCYYSKVFIMTFVIVYDLLFTVNFYFVPRQLDVFIEDMIFYFTDLSVLSKVLTFVFMRNKITDLLETLESEQFQPDDAEGISILEKSKKFNKTYWKIVAVVSITSNMTHVLSPLLAHLKSGVQLMLPVCSYSFLSDELIDKFIYPLYFYQCIGIHFHMLYNVNIDTFFLGLMVLTIAQLDILDKKLRKVTYENNDEDVNGVIPREPSDKNEEAIKKINQCVIHFDEVSK